MSNLVYWIWFASLRGIRHGVRRALLDRFGEPKEIFFADARELSGVEGITEGEVKALGDRELGFAERTVTRCAEEDVRILTFQDAEYPERLKYISDPPYVLYVKGKLPSIDSSVAVAVVGTRSSTPYGEKMSRNIGYEIANCGGIVVTGLAAGNDSRAAEGALMAQGKVIGVLGTAINEVFPSWNTRLFDDVQASGALISEYPPDFPGNKNYFRERDRIMAGLSLATVVTQSPLRSGALITARRALDYGRDVYAVPANADAKNSAGSNNLLREGARIAENGWDVLSNYEDMYPGAVWRDGARPVPEEMREPEPAEKKVRVRKKADGDDKEGEERAADRGFLKFRVPTRRKAAQEPQRLAEQLGELNENQLKLVAVMSKPRMHVDDIIDLSLLPAATVLSELTVMQIKGVVSQEAGKRFTLNISKRG